jgi:homospermidine synthase
MASESIQRWVEADFKPPRIKQVLRDELTTGFDQLGVLLIFPGGAFWYGSTLALNHAREIAPDNNATTLQVVAGILGGIEWMRANPKRGVVEAEAMDYREVLNIAKPYLGNVSGVMTDWQPDSSGQLQFINFLLSRHVISPLKGEVA